MTTKGMSYAVLAGLPPVYGLFAAMTAPVVYTVLGTSRHLSIGPVALVSLALPRVCEVGARRGRGSRVIVCIYMCGWMDGFMDGRTTGGHEPPIKTETTTPTRNPFGS